LVAKPPQSHQQYEDVIFKGVDLTNSEIDRSEFRDCEFIRCDFSDTLFQSCRVIDCTFKDCALRMSRFEDTAFATVTFKHCNLMGVDWTAINTTDWVVQLGSLAFENCQMRYSIFTAMDFSGTTLTDCDLREANFVETDFTQSKFKGTDFAGAIFHQTILKEADFVGAKNYTLDVNTNTTKNARFALPEAMRLLLALDIKLIDPDTNEPVDPAVM
jgi:fluoroquinolone resistance protein